VLLAILTVLLGVAPVTAQESPAGTGAPGEEVIRLPEIQVSAPARLPEFALSPSSIPATLQVIPGADIRESGAPNLQEYLTRLPGLTVNDEQGNSAQLDLSFRGFQGTSVTGIPQGVSVFLDGVRINEPTVEEINFDLIPLDDVERIELIRGPSAVFGRNTLGGSINIITRRGGPTREIEPVLEGGSFGRQKYRLSLGGTEDLIDYYFSATLAREDGWRDEAQSRIGRAFGKLGYKHTGTDLTLSYQYVENRIEQAGSLPESLLREDRTLNFTGGDFYKPYMNFVTLNLRQELTEELSLSLNAFGRQLDVEQFNVSLIGENTRQFNDSTSAGGTLQIAHHTAVFGRENRLVAGVEYSHFDVSSNTFEEQNETTLPECLEEAIAAGEDPAQACPPSQLASRVVDKQDTVGVYLQDTLDLARSALFEGDSLVLTAAGRFDWIRHDIKDLTPVEPGRPNSTQESRFDRINPRLGINYNFSKDYGVFAAYSQGFRAPAFLELTCAGPGAICPGLQAGVAPDPPLKSVKATNYELGFRARPLPWLEGELSLFRTDVEDDIFSVTPTGTIGLFFQNIGDTRRQGLELGIRGRFGSALEAYLNYAYTAATFETTAELATPRLTAGCTTPPCTQLVRPGNDIPLIPNHRLNLGVDYHLTPWLTLFLTGSVVGEQRLRGDEANEEQPLDPYFVMSGGARAHWRRLSAFLTINNLLDARYETFGTFAPNAREAGDPIERFLTPGPPINLVAGISYRF
jgi:outer membrane receptor protein involved in Fe transport